MTPTSFTQLRLPLWQRASTVVAEEIERGRARGQRVMEVGKLRQAVGQP